LAHNRIPGALVFEGPASAGLQTWALALVKGVLCPEREGDFCGVCQVCEQVDREIHPDLRMMAPEGQGYKKEQVEVILEENPLKPLSGRRRFFVLREAHRMNQAFANAFLKVLEEPARHTTFMLLTSNHQGLLPTIMSRCLHLRLFSPDPREVMVKLRKQGLDEHKARLGAYLNLGEEDLSDFDALVLQRNRVLEDLAALLTGRGRDRVILAWSEAGRSRETFLREMKREIYLLSTLLRDIMLVHMGADRRLLIHGDVAGELERLKERTNLPWVTESLHGLDLLRRDMERNLNTRVLAMKALDLLSPQA